MDSVGDVYVADFGHNSVKEVLVDGDIRTIATGVAQPNIIAVDPAGDLFVNGDYSDSVTELLSNGSSRNFFVTATSGSNYVGDLATDAAGDLFVADYYGNKITEFFPGGTMQVIGSGFIRPDGVDVDASGDVFVSDSGNFAVKEVFPNGTIKVINPNLPAYPEDVKVDPEGEVFVSLQSHTTLVELSPVAVAATPLSVNGSSPSAVSATLTGLLPNTTYYDRTYAVDSGGGSIGTTQSFNTPAATPTVTTAVSQTGSVVGSALIGDSAVVASGYNPTGTITFTLTAPDGSTTTVGTVTVNGDRTYNSSTMTATEVGLYSWHASYGGDVYNNSAADQGGSAEQATVVKASPALSTTAAETNGGILGGPTSLSDSAVLTGGDSPTGTITFTLTAPDGTTSTIGSASITADGTFGSPTVVPTEAGTYTWHASYGGDADNNTAADQGGSSEQIITVVPAAPAVITGVATDVTPTGADLAGTVNPFGTSAVVTFRYSTDPTFSTSLLSTTATQSPVGGSSAGAVSVTLAHLNAGTIYYYRAVATDLGGTIDGAANSFTTTTLPPVVTTTAPTAITSTSVTLNGTVNPEGATAIAEFQYSTSPSFTPTVLGPIGNGFNLPTAVAVDGKGDVFVADTNDSAIKEIEPNGMVLTIGSGFQRPRGVAVDAAGDVFVSDTDHYQIDEVMPNGTIVTIGSGFYQPQGLAVDQAGDVYVADSGHDEVKEVLTSGSIRTIGSNLYDPTGVALDPAGDVFIADYGHNTVVELMSDGSTRVIGSQFSNPDGVAVDAAGDVFVADTNSGAVKEVLPNGTIVALATGLNYPTAVAVDGDGDIYIADSNDNRVDALTPPTIAAVPSPLSGSPAMPVSAALTGLSPATTYYYRTVALGTFGTGVGAAVSFTTLPTSSVLSLTAPGVYLRLDADGQNVDVWNAQSPAGSFAKSYAVSQISSITFGGSFLGVDFSMGNPVGSAGVMDTGSGTAVLDVVGSPQADAVTVNGSSVVLTNAAGTGKIVYSGLSLIDFNGDGGSDTLTQTAQPNAGLRLVNPTNSDALAVTGGTFTFPAATAGSGVTAVNLGSITIGAVAQVKLQAPDVNADRTALVLGTLSVAGSAGAWTGQLDVSGNDLIVHTATLDQITSLLQGGYDNGKWDGNGIDSSAASSDSTHLTAVGVLENDVSGAPVYSAASPFDGIAPALTDVLVKYTYYGDANLDGKVDGSDYSLTDAGYAGGPGTGTWQNGDFNYDRVVDGTDYSLIDNAFNNQGGVLPAAQMAVAAVIVAQPAVVPPKSIPATQAKPSASPRARPIVPPVAFPTWSIQPVLMPVAMKEVADLGQLDRLIFDGSSASIDVGT